MIYFDYAATTPIDKQVLKAMLPYFANRFGNPSSVHCYGQEAESAVDLARRKIATFLGCQMNEAIFTSGATESNNLAITGVMNAVRSKWLIHKPNIITSLLEHPSVLEAVRQLEQDGVKVYYIKPEKNGIVDANKIAKVINKNTALVSIIYANNVIGTIQPIVEISKVIKEHRKHDTRNSSFKFPFFHTDATQAINYLNTKVNDLKIDLLTLSGHKIYGPKGIGVLYVRDGVPLRPILYGGGQERGLRSGTLNVPLIVGLSKAIELAGLEINNRKIDEIKKLRDALIDNILKIEGSILGGSRDKRLVNNAYFSFENISAEELIISLDLAGVAVSSGPACSAKAITTSATLSALNIDNGIRFSLGKFTTKKEIDFVCKILPKIIKRLRS